MGRLYTVISCKTAVSSHETWILQKLKSITVNETGTYWMIIVTAFKPVS